jgi:hypothetical protein
MTTASALLIVLCLGSSPAGAPNSRRAEVGRPVVARSWESADPERQSQPEAESFAAVRARAVQVLIEDLRTFSEWADVARLFIERNKAYEAILTFLPDDEVAHRGLGDRRDRDGVWQKPKDRRAPKDFDPSKVEEAGRRLAAIRARYCEAVFAALDRAPQELALAERERVLDEILGVDPDNARARAARGESQLEGRWVLLETVVGKTRRAEIRAQIEKAFQECPAAVDDEISVADRSYGLAWTAALRTGGMRAIGTVDREELARTAEALTVAQRVVAQLLGKEFSFREGATVFLLNGPEGRIPLIEHHPEVGADARAFLLSLDSAQLGQGDFATWAKEEERRLDASVRLAIAHLMAGAFHTTTQHGWVAEGFGLYLTRELVGTRLTWFAKPSEYLQAAADRELRERLFRPETNWIGEAFTLLKERRGVRMANTFGRDVNALTVDDLLLSYAFAAYLLESRPEKVTRLLTRVGKGEQPTAVIEEELGQRLDRFEERLLRWLEERR